MNFNMATMCTVVSALAPLLGMAACAMLASAAKSGGMASGIGGLFQGLVALSLACAVGGVSALAAMSQGMQPRWVAIVLLVANGLLGLPGIWVLARMDWE
jgi:hypothetical protein